MYIWFVNIINIKCNSVLLKLLVNVFFYFYLEVYMDMFVLKVVLKFLFYLYKFNEIELMEFI